MCPGALITGGRFSFEPFETRVWLGDDFNFIALALFLALLPPHGAHHLRWKLQEGEGYREFGLDDNMHSNLRSPFRGCSICQA